VLEGSKQVPLNELSQLLPKKWVRRMPRGTQDMALVELRHATSFFVPQRFDLSIKFDYALAFKENRGRAFADEIYDSHMRAFNGLVESDGSGKVGAERFRTEFDKLLRAALSGGLLDFVLPVSSGGVLLDGAHRVAASAASDSYVAVFRFPVPDPDYGVEYFAHRGLDNDFIYHGLRRQLSVRGQARALLVWPACELTDSEIEALIDQSVTVVHRLRLQTVGDTLAHLVLIAYRDEPWRGSRSDGFAGVKNKATWCDADDGPIRVWFLDGEEAALVKIRREIRSRSMAGQHSAHLTDTHAEALDLANTVLNSSSLGILQTAPLVPPRWFARMFEAYDEWLGGTETAIADRAALDGSAPIAIHGLRDVRDLDFITDEESLVDGPSTSGISARADPAELYGIPVDELLSDSRMHGYYWGRKVVALEVIRAAKARRAEVKDLADVALIDTLGAMVRRQTTVSDRLRRCLSVRYQLALLKRLAFRVRYLIRIIKLPLKK
jgi:hypothetical protein